MIFVKHKTMNHILIGGSSKYIQMTMMNKLLDTTALKNNNNLAFCVLYNMVHKSVWKTPLKNPFFQEIFKSRSILHSFQISYDSPRDRQY